MDFLNRLANPQNKTKAAFLLLNTFYYINDIIFDGLVFRHKDSAKQYFGWVE